MKSYDSPPIEDYLEHHGIKGQKWGVRRFQNEDGSYTAAGKKRYGYVESPNDPRTKIFRDLQEEKSQRRQAKMIANELSNIDNRRYKKAVKTRDKLADDADRKIQYYQNQAKSAKDEYESLKKEGESDFIKRQKSYMDFEMSDDDIESVFGMSLKEYYNEELSRVLSTQKSSIQSAKAYVKYRDDLMNMDLSHATKKDVTKQAKRLLRNVLDSTYDDEDENEDDN